MTDPSAFHEDLAREHEVVQGSPRSFGLLFFAVFMIIGLVPLLVEAEVRWWSLGVGVGFALSGLLAPQLLAPLNALWLKFGALLHAVVSPVVLALLFVGVVLPTGLMLRLFGGNQLRLQRDASKPTYWIERNPPGPDPESLRQQF